MSAGKARWLLGCTVVGALVFGAPIPGPGEPWPWQADRQVCLEDMPCWDCSAMGNGICGKDAQ